MGGGAANLAPIAQRYRPGCHWLGVRQRVFTRGYLNSAGAMGWGAVNSSPISSPAVSMVLPRTAVVTAASIISSAKRRVAWSSARVALRIAAESSPRLILVNLSLAVEIAVRSSPVNCFHAGLDGARSTADRIVSASLR